MDWIIDDGVLLGVKNPEPKLILPDGVRVVRAGCFRRNPVIREVHLSAEMQEIESHAFQNCPQLQMVSFPASLQFIGARAFENCISLQELDISSPRCRLGERAFAGCTRLQNIRLAASAASLGSAVFYGCSRVENFVLAEGSASAEQRAQQGISDSDGFLIRDTVLLGYFGSNADVRIPPSVTAIAPKAFQNRSSLKSVEFPPALRSIGYSAFDGCIALETIHLPSSVHEVGVNAFRQCRALTDVLLPSSCRLGHDSFYGCCNVRFIEPPAVSNETLGVPDEEGFLIRDGVLLNYWGSTQYICVPEGVRTIAPQAFNRAFSSFDSLYDLSRIYLPASLECLDFIPGLRGGGIALELPFHYLKARQPLPEEDTLQWLKSKWLEVSIADWASLYLHQDGALHLMAHDRLLADPDAAIEALAKTISGTVPNEQQAKRIHRFCRLVSRHVSRDMLSQFETLKAAAAKELQKRSVTCAEAEGETSQSVSSEKTQSTDAPGEEGGALLVNEPNALALLRRMRFGGRSISPVVWEETFVRTGFLQRLTPVIVWGQQGETFMHFEDKTVGLDGKKVKVASDGPVEIAHRGNMCSADADAWRRSLRAQNLEVWNDQLREPYYVEIHSDRFLGCHVPIGELRGLEEDGILLYHLDHNEIGLEIRGAVRLGSRLELPYGRKAEENDCLTLGIVDVEEMNPQTNHIVAVLDRLTCRERLQRDDPALSVFFESLSDQELRVYLAQAMEAGAAHAVASLLDAQRKRGGSGQDFAL